MKWISIDNEEEKLETKDVVLNNMSNINSLFLPDNIDYNSNINNIFEKYDDYDIIFYILNMFFGEDIEESILWIPGADGYKPTQEFEELKAEVLKMKVYEPKV